MNLQFTGYVYKIHNFNVSKYIVQYACTMATNAIKYPNIFTYKYVDQLPYLMSNVVMCAEMDGKEIVEHYMGGMIPSQNNFSKLLKLRGIVVNSDIEQIIKKFEMVSSTFRSFHIPVEFTAFNMSYYYINYVLDLCKWYKHIYIEIINIKLRLWQVY